MTPKEKAKELVEKFDAACESYIAAKECALIAVDEILNLDSGDAINEDFWLQVKQEIENL